MAPTLSEESILGNFLISPASLPTIISLQKFTELFPKRLQSHPQIKVLYRELQEIRSQNMDLVRENIMQEIQHGKKQRADLLAAMKSSGVDGMDMDQIRETELDLRLFDQSSTEQRLELHSLSSLMTDMESACAALEQEIASTEERANLALEKMTRIVGEMSDLRYGKFNKPGLTTEEYVEETVNGLSGLEEACDRVVFEND